MASTTVIKGHGEGVAVANKQKSNTLKVLSFLITVSSTLQPKSYIGVYGGRVLVCGKTHPAQALGTGARTGPPTRSTRAGWRCAIDMVSRTVIEGHWEGVAVGARTGPPTPSTRAGWRCAIDMVSRTVIEGHWEGVAVVQELGHLLLQRGQVEGVP